MTPDTLDARKSALRQAAMGRRRELTASLPEAGAHAAAQFLSAIPGASGAKVALYWPIRSELDARPLLDALATSGAQIALPAIVAAGAPLAFREYAPGATLVPGPFGVREPRDDAKNLIPQIVVAPLLAFDLAGGRLGYGGGYYDRTLAALRSRGPVIYVGYGFSGQEAAEVPMGAGDARLDWIVTERGARRF
ncbi:MAG: 5-formyltetrahydrofolate cyclo-ligase [Parvularculaceae bacterium]